jgi:hypothetical protein
MVTEVDPPSWRSSPRIPIWRRDEGWSRQSMAHLFKGSNYPEILGPFLNWFREAGYVGMVELNACVGIRGEGSGTATKARSPDLTVRRDVT